MKKKIKKTFLPLIIALFILPLTYAIEIFQNSKDTQLDTKLYEVVRIVDGDTIRIIYNGKEEPLRLIGIDTPESVHPESEKNTYLGSCATAFTTKLIEGKKITLEFDVTNKDQYGRLLAYVYIDGVMLNKTLIEEGYAQVSTYPPNVKYADEFVELEKIAKEHKRGLWNEDNCLPQKHEEISDNDRLPLKALCNDGSYAYATSPDKEDYRGMCTGHSGIKNQLGRVE